MTPSGAYKSGSDNDAGHDDFQAHIWRSLAGQSLLRKEGDATVKYEYYSHGIELALKGKSGITAFVDVFAFYKYGKSTFSVYREIKPVIHSVGAIVRQCRALSHAARSHAIVSGISETDYSVVISVPFTDPKFALLKEISPYRVEGWDWERAL